MNCFKFLLIFLVLVSCSDEDILLEDQSKLSNSDTSIRNGPFSNGYSSLSEDEIKFADVVLGSQLSIDEIEAFVESGYTLALEKGIKHSVNDAFSILTFPLIRNEKLDGVYILLGDTSEYSFQIFAREYLETQKDFSSAINRVVLDAFIVHEYASTGI